MELKIIIENEKYPLHLYADGTTSSEVINGKKCIGVIWEKPDALIKEEVVEPKFHLGDYAFAGGEFSKDKNAFPKRLGIVVYINPDVNAPKGQRGIILAESENVLPWATRDEVTGATENVGGLNCHKLLEIVQANENVHYPAAEYCLNYRKEGVGGWFLPSWEELNKCMMASPNMFTGGYWTSSEQSSSSAWRLAKVGITIQKLLSVKDAKLKVIPIKVI